MTTQEAA
jgi:hypothetical protein